MQHGVPWQRGESILDVVRRWDGSGDAELVLPDEPPHDPARIRWSAGSLEGAMIRHGLGLDEEAREESGIRARVRRLVGGRRDVPADIVSHLRRLVRHPADEERLGLYRILQSEDVLTNIDTVIDRLVGDRDLLVASAPHARWLVTEARHRGPLKFGIALLGVAGEPGDAELVKELAGHDEFTMYCSVALQHLVADPTDELWEVAKRTRGWGKIDAVERLAPLVADRPDIKRWLLTDGCENAVMSEYLGYACATAGGLEDALAGEVDDALLDGACTIVSALCRGGPAEDLDDYADGPAVVEQLLDLLQDRCHSLERLDTVVDLLQWLEDEPSEALPPEVDAGEYARWHAERRARQREHGWSDEFRADLVERCQSIIRQPYWPDRLKDALEHGERQDKWTAWRVAPKVGLDLWDAGFAKLRREPLDDGLVFELMHGSDRTRQARVVEWAEHHLPAEKIATGPADHLFPAEHGEIETSLVFIVQEMRSGGPYSERLVASALLSPVIGTRNQALNAVESQPREGWGSSAEAALHRLAAEDPDADVRARAAGLLAQS
jgi:hypothetical protein